MFSELDARLCLHTGGEMMLDQRHLGDEISRGQELRFRVPPGHNHVQTVATTGKDSDDVIEVQVVVTQRNVEFVENNKPKARIVPSARAPSTRPVRPP